MIIRDVPELADMLCEIIETIAAHSYTLQASPEKQSVREYVQLESKSASWELEAQGIDPVLDPEGFKRSLNDSLSKCLYQERGGLRWPYSRQHHERHVIPSNLDFSNTSRAFVVPLVQAGFADVNHELDLLKSYIVSLSHFHSPNPSHHYHCTLASAYMNLSDSWTRILSQDFQGKLTFISPSSMSHGFKDASGIAGLVPYAYHLLQHEAITSIQGQDRIRSLEYTRNEWDFHCKGMWFSEETTDRRYKEDGIYKLSDSECEWPFATVIGSSNYGSRSVSKDLELQILMWTANGCLRERMAHEMKSIITHTGPMSTARFSAPKHTPLLGRMFVRTILSVLKKWM